MFHSYIKPLVMLIPTKIAPNSQVGHCDAQHGLLCARTDALSVGRSTGSAARCEGAPSDA